MQFDSAVGHHLLLFTTKHYSIMKKKEEGRFGGLIEQMNRDKHRLVLVNLGIAKPFAAECIRRGYDIEIGDAYKDGIVIYRK